MKSVISRVSLLFIPAVGSSSRRSLGRVAEGAGDLEPALVAVGQVAGPRVGPLLEPDQLEQAHPLVDRPGLLVEHRRRAQRSRPTSGS